MAKGEAQSISAYTGSHNFDYYKILFLSVMRKISKPSFDAYKAHPNLQLSAGVENTQYLPAEPFSSIFQDIFPNISSEALYALELPTAFFIREATENSEQEKQDRIIKEAYLMQTGAYRYLDPDNQEMERVREEFQRINEKLKLSKDSVWGTLGGIGCNDLDIRFKKQKMFITEDAVENDIGFEPSETLALNALFLDIYKGIFETSYGQIIPEDPNKPKFLSLPVTEVPILEGKEHETLLNDSLTARTLIGHPPTNNKIHFATSEISQYVNDVLRPVCKVDIGYFGNFDAEKRLGSTVSKKANIGLKLKAVDDRLIIDESDNSLRQKKDELYGMDRFEQISSDPDIGNEVERVLRAIRLNMFYHREKKEIEGKPFFQEDVLANMFDDASWRKIRDTFNNAAMIFKEGGLPDNKEQLHLFTKEVLVMIEQDPYLFLQIAEKTDLLKIFPAFRNVSVDFIRSLMASDALTFKKIEGSKDPRTPLLRRRRNSRSYMESRQIWQNTSYSGLKLFTDALFGFRRNEQNEHLTRDDQKMLFYEENGQEYGVFSFTDEHLPVMDKFKLNYYEAFEKAADNLISYEIHKRIPNADNHIIRVLKLIYLNHYKGAKGEVNLTHLINKNLGQIFNNLPRDLEAVQNKISSSVFMKICPGSKQNEMKCTTTKEFDQLCQLWQTVSYLKAQVRGNTSKHPPQSTFHFSISTDFSEGVPPEESNPYIKIDLDYVMSRLFDSGIVTPFHTENHSFAVTPLNILDALSYSSWQNFKFKNDRELIYDPEVESMARGNLLADYTSVSPYEYRKHYAKRMKEYLMEKVSGKLSRFDKIDNLDLGIDEFCLMMAEHYIYDVMRNRYVYPYCAYYHPPKDEELGAYIEQDVKHMRTKK